MHGRYGFAAMPSLASRAMTASRSIDRKSTRLNSSHTEIYTLSLHDALPICAEALAPVGLQMDAREVRLRGDALAREPGDDGVAVDRSEEHTSELQSHRDLHSFPTRRSSDLCRSARASRAADGCTGGTASRRCPRSRAGR